MPFTAYTELIEAAGLFGCDTVVVITFSQEVLPRQFL
jgi:hypothetical protein